MNAVEGKSVRSIEAASDELGDLMRSPYHAAVATATTVKVAKQFFKIAQAE